MQEKSIHFTHCNRQLEVQATDGAEGCKVLILENGKPVKEIDYDVSCETIRDAQSQESPLDLVDELLKIVRSDIEQGIIKLP